MYYNWISILGVGFAFLLVISSVKIIIGIGLRKTLKKRKQEGYDIESGFRSIFTTPNDNVVSRKSAKNLLAF